jgi:hypothetical protein
MVGSNSHVISCELLCGCGATAAIMASSSSLVGVPVVCGNLHLQVS